MGKLSMIGQMKKEAERDFTKFVKYVAELEEENKKLKSDLAYERTMLDNVKAEYENLQDVIKKLNERIRFLEQCLDNKEKVNKNLREEIRNLKKELGKITVHSNMLESENILLKKECKARLERIKELEK